MVRGLPKEALQVRHLNDVRKRHKPNKIVTGHDDGSGTHESDSESTSAASPFYHVDSTQDESTANSSKLSETPTYIHVRRSHNIPIECAYTNPQVITGT